MTGFAARKLKECHGRSRVEMVRGESFTFEVTDATQPRPDPKNRPPSPSNSPTIVPFIYERQQPGGALTYIKGGGQDGGSWVVLVSG